MGRISIDGALAVVAAAFAPYTGDLDRTNRGTRVRLVVYDQRGKYVHETPETDDGVIYVFATKGGAPSNPDWYYNLTTVGEGSIERGTDSYPVTVRKVTGDERDRVYAEQARRYPGFADYAKQTEGIRTIPVLALTRT